MSSESISLNALDPALNATTNQQCLCRGTSLTSVGSATSASFPFHTPSKQSTDDSTLITMEVQTLIGTTFSLIAFTTDTIAHLKAQILFEQNWCNIDNTNMSWTLGNVLDTVVIVYKGTTLANNDATLSDYGIHADTRINVFPRLQTGIGNPSTEVSDMLARTELMDRTVEPGTILVLCNQEHELFVLEVQLRNRQGQIKMIRNPDGSEKTYIDMSLSDWNAERISNALVQGGELLQELFVEVERLEGPLLGIELLHANTGDASAVLSRPVSAEELLRGPFNRGSSTSLTCSSKTSLQLSRQTSHSSEIWSAYLASLQGNSEHEIKTRSSTSSEDLYTHLEPLPPIMPTRSRPATRYRQRNHTVADPCHLAVHEYSQPTEIIIDTRRLSRPLPSIPLEVTSVGEEHFSTLPVLPRPLSPPICKMCSKRLRIGLAHIKCKCGLRFCSDHKAESKHHCTWDWKGKGKSDLQQQLTACIAPKVSSI